jgi:hypothetical protein
VILSFTEAWLGHPLNVLAVGWEDVGIILIQSGAQASCCTAVHSVSELLRFGEWQHDAGAPTMSEMGAVWNPRALEVVEERKGC